MILAANWKMNKTAAEAASFVQGYAGGLSEWVVPTVLLVPFTTIPAVAEACSHTGIPKQRLAYGAQNFYYEAAGAFTGEVSADQLLEFGCRHVICGHSERRHVFGESDDLIGKKVRRAVDKDLVPIFCIGETLPERESGQLESVLTRQIEEGLSGVSATNLSKVVMAYEPVWAIGTGVVATPEQAEEAHAFVRKLLVSSFGASASRVPILYGGSVNAENAYTLMIRPGIDGALVGGASLKVESLLALHAACVKAAKEKGEA
ncbi:triose-phosphate isomerase [candidate division KSB1 bacterium]|nr:MAG: triose-phosphate isomerase [candidate division KSB1 bacterium]